MTQFQDVPTSEGTARLWIDDAAAPRLRLVLGHGAGGGAQARDLAALAAELPADGVSVIRAEQPWRVAGKRVAPRPEVLDRGWTGLLGAVPHDVPVVVGGRSAGARVACRTATAVGAAGVVALAFPLHPPGKPERSRAPELLGTDVPAVVIQGARDPFGRPDEFPDAGPPVVPVPHADHSMAVPKAHDQSEALAVVVAAAREFLQRFVG